MTNIANKDASTKIRVGLIGAGNWANHGHLRVLDLLPNYEVVAVQARRPEAARSAADRFGIPVVAATEDELLRRPDIDLVAVLNTAPQHADTVRAVIEAGKDVYCEWPLTTSASIAEELAQMARAAGVRHIVGLQRRLAPHNRYLRDLIADGYVGKLRSVRMHVSMNYFQATRSPAFTWTAPMENFSSVASIYGGHFLDMLFEGVGWPQAVSALLVNQFPEILVVGTDERIQTTAPDQFLLTGSLDGSGVLTVQIEGGKCNGSGVEIDITGNSGDIRITNVSAFGDVGDDYIIMGAHGDKLPLRPLEIPVRYDWLPPSGLPSAVLELANLYAAFARDRATGSLTASTFDDAVRLHKLFDLFEQSSNTGQRLPVD